MKRIVRASVVENVESMCFGDEDLARALGFRLLVLGRTLGSARLPGLRASKRGCNAATWRKKLHLNNWTFGRR